MSASSEMTATLSESAVETPPAHVSKTDQVAELLRGTQAPPVPSPETDPAPESLPAEKLDLKTVAERLQVEPAKLYQDLMVPIADGEELSVSELKDRYRSAKELDRLREEHTRARGEYEADRLRSERELQAILAAIPRESISPALAEEWQKQQREYLGREREALLRAIPDWTDAAVLTADRGEIEGYLKEYGFSRADLDNVTDHRLLRLLRDAAKGRAKAKAEDKPPPAKVAVAPRKLGAGSEAQRFGQLKAAVTKGQMTRTEAVARILKGN